MNIIDFVLDAPGRQAMPIAVYPGLHLCKHNVRAMVTDSDAQYEALLKLQQDYVQEATALWNQSLQGNPPLKDRRFKGAAWAENPLASFNAAVYLLNARTLMAMAEAAQGDAKTKNRIRFAVEQWVAAAAPSNYLAFNAEAQQKAIDTQGESLAKGLANQQLTAGCRVFP